MKLKSFGTLCCLRGFPDGIYLHRPAVVVQAWQRAGGVPRKENEKNCFCVRLKATILL